MTDTSGSNPHPVIVIGTTNNPEKLPDSLRRRFNISYPVTRPSLEDRKAFIQIQLQEKRAQGINPVFLEKLAQEMHNCSLVEIKNVFDQAALLAMNSPQNKRLSEFHLQAAFNTEIRGILAAQESDPKKDSITAAYQTSKAFMHSLLRQESLITAVTILPVKAKIDYKPAQEITQDDPNINMQLVSPLEKPLIYHGSVFTAENVSEKEFMSKQDIKNRIFELLAGQAGLKIMLGNTYPDFNPEDNAECFQIISRLIAKGEKATDAAKKMVNERFKQFKQAAEQKLTPHKETLFILSYLLQKRQLVEGADWNSLVEKIKANPKPYAEKILQQPNHASLLVSKFQEIGRINKEKKSTFDSEKK
jgi:SpoVK/Ycf46/Vps4 family AAA+-type ATPase